MEMVGSPGGRRHLSLQGQGLADRAGAGGAQTADDVPHAVSHPVEGAPDGGAHAGLLLGAAEGRRVGGCLLAGQAVGGWGCSDCGLRAAHHLVRIRHRPSEAIPDPISDGAHIAHHVVDHTG